MDLCLPGYATKTTYKCIYVDIPIDKYSISFYKKTFHNIFYESIYFNILNFINKKYFINIFLNIKF